MKCFWKNHGRCFAGVILSLATCTILHASKVEEVRQVDSTHLMVYLKDGEVIYKDDGTGTSAYKGGHESAEGDDQLIAFGQELDTDAASVVENWTLIAAHEKAIGEVKMHPVEVFRKSKVRNTDRKWNYKLDHWIFLKFSEPFRQGLDYVLKINPKTNVDRTEIPFTYDVFTSCSEAIHVNLLGYA